MRMTGRWIVMGAGLLAVASTAKAQIYPGGFGGYGWGGWGGARNIVSDPNSDYLQGIGYYMKAKGDYAVKQQEANKIEIENVAKWNKALREANRLKRIDDARVQAQVNVQNDFARRQQRIQNGELLNEQLDHMLDFPSEATKSALAKVPLSPDALRSIAFENETEALSLCLDEMTSDDAWPVLLKSDQFAGPRQELSEAVDAALKEDMTGPLSDATRDKLKKAGADFRTALDEKVPFFSPGKNDAQLYLIRLAAMVRMLDNAKARPIVHLLETYKEGSLLDLAKFMHAFNLRFGPAKGAEQVQVYQDLYDQFSKIPTGFEDAKVADEKPLEQATKELAAASQDVFKNLEWGDLDKQAQGQEK